jgi:lipopolysaccharide/colanic/teichoic acid biosynthesis glycosyltransferase
MASKIYLSELAVEKSAIAPAGTAAERLPALSLSILAIFGFIADASTCSAVLFLALLLRLGHDGAFASPDERTWLFCASAGLCITLLLQHGEREGTPASIRSIDRTAASIRTCLLALVFLPCGSFLLRPDFPEMATVVGLAVLPVALAVQRRVLRDSFLHESNVTEIEDATDQPRESYNGRPLPISSRQVLDYQCFQDGSFDFYTAFVKRLLDLAMSSALIVLLSPLLLLIAVLIRLNSKGPAIFVQERVGLGGRRFRMYKFRSMSSDADRYQRSPKSSRDTRITAVGRVLRRTSLDELPQLFNVVRGNMSLVGPRPEMPFIVDGYDDTQRLRLCVVPGITGFWQLSRDRAFPIHENLQHDFSYIRRRSFCMDIAILIHTLLFAMRGGI